MHEQILSRLLSRFEAYSDLAETLDDDLLTQAIDLPKHKTLAEHLWCVVGARESYARAIEQGSWAGFSCSMKASSTTEFREKLRDSSKAAELAIRAVSDWSEERSDLLATLAEHEVMHEGQIIRHIYALDRNLPESWIWA